MPVKAPRRYDSPGRREKAEVTRLRITEGACQLFTERGYAATTMDAIAAQADVAIQTIYAVFGSKRRLLKEMVDVYCGGEEEFVPPLERKLLRQALAEPDAHKQIRMYARNARVVYERVSPVLRVVRAAAAVDADIVPLWVANKAHRQEIDRRLVRALAAKGQLRKGVGVARATDMASAVTSPEMFDLLVDEKGWSPARWERWAADVLICQLPDSAGDSP